MGLLSVFGACIGVATGPTGTDSEQSHVAEYLREFNLWKRNKLRNPPPERLRRCLEQKIDSFQQSQLRSNWRSFPWTDKEKLQIDRLAATVISFTDDHKGEIFLEYFPLKEMNLLIREIIRAYEITGTETSIGNQYWMSLNYSQGHPLAASILLHAAYRAVARSRDTRVDKSLKFPVKNEQDPSEPSMLSLARATASFEDGNDLDDPLGDTYHFWAEYAIGMAIEFESAEGNRMSPLYSPLFFYGPNLMSLVREKVLRKTQAAGNHLYEDRTGLRLGKEIARGLVNGHLK